MFYRVMAWTAYIIMLGIMVMAAGLCAKVMNSSLIHNPENNVANGISSLFAIFIMGSPFVIGMPYKIIINLYLYPKKIGLVK